MKWKGGGVDFFHQKLCLLIRIPDFGFSNRRWKNWIVIWVVDRILFSGIHNTVYLIFNELMGC